MSSRQKEEKKNFIKNDYNQDIVRELFTNEILSTYSSSRKKIEPENNEELLPENETFYYSSKGAFPFLTIISSYNLNSGKINYNPLYTFHIKNRKTSSNLKKLNNSQLIALKSYGSSKDLTNKLKKNNHYIFISCLPESPHSKHERKLKIEKNNKYIGNRLNKSIDSFKPYQKAEAILYEKKNDGEKKIFQKKYFSNKVEPNNNKKNNLINNYTINSITYRKLKEKKPVLKPIKISNIYNIISNNNNLSQTFVNNYKANNENTSAKKTNESRITNDNNYIINPTKEKSFIRENIIKQRMKKNVTMDKKFRILSMNSSSMEKNFFYNPLKKNQKRINDISYYTKNINKAKENHYNLYISNNQNIIMRNSDFNNDIKVITEFKKDKDKTINSYNSNYKDIKKNNYKKNEINIVIPKKRLIKIVNSKFINNKNVKDQNKSNNINKKEIKEIKHYKISANYINKNIINNIIRNDFKNKNKKEENHEKENYKKEKYKTYNFENEQKRFISLNKCKKDEKRKEEKVKDYNIIKKNFNTEIEKNSKEREGGQEKDIKTKIDEKKDVENNKKDKKVNELKKDVTDIEESKNVKKDINYINEMQHKNEEIIVEKNLEKNEKISEEKNNYEEILESQKGISGKNEKIEEKNKENEKEEIINNDDNNKIKEKKLDKNEIQENNKKQNEKTFQNQENKDNIGMEIDKGKNEEKKSKKKFHKHKHKLKKIKTENTTIENDSNKLQKANKNKKDLKGMIYFYTSSSNINDKDFSVTNESYDAENKNKPIEENKQSKNANISNENTLNNKEIQNIKKNDIIILNSDGTSFKDLEDKGIIDLGTEEFKPYVSKYPEKIFKKRGIGNKKYKIKKKENKKILCLNKNINKAKKEININDDNLKENEKYSSYFGDSVNNVYYEIKQSHEGNKNVNLNQNIKEKEFSSIKIMNKRSNRSKIRSNNIMGVQSEELYIPKEI